MTDYTTPYLGTASFEERMAALKALAQEAGIRLPSTIIPEGESLIPYGEERKRALACEVNSLPTLNDALQALHSVRTASAPKDVTVPVQRVRMEPNRGGLYGNGQPKEKAIGYTETGFRQVADFVRPSGINVTSTLLALPPKIRSEAFNHFASNSVRSADDQVVLRTILAPAKNGWGPTRRIVRAVTSERYTVVDDVDITATLESIVPAGARVRVTQTWDRSDIEILWPAMSRELKVGDIALIALQVTNSETKHSSIRVAPKLLRVLCLNFTTAWSDGADEEISIRHMGEARSKFARAMQRALQIIEPFVHAFGDAYNNPLPEFAPTRGEVLQRFVKRNELPASFGQAAVDIWDADGAKSAGDTLAGLANSITRASQQYDMAFATRVEQAAGKLIARGWSELS